MSNIINNELVVKLIAYVSDPLNRFNHYEFRDGNLVLTGDRYRGDRQSLILRALSDYYSKTGVLEKNGFIDLIARETIKDYMNMELDEKEFRRNLELILSSGSKEKRLKHLQMDLCKTCPITGFKL